MLPLVHGWSGRSLSSLAIVMVVEGWHHLPSAMVEPRIGQGCIAAWPMRASMLSWLEEGATITHAFAGVVEVAIVKDDV